MNKILLENEKTPTIRRKNEINKDELKIIQIMKKE